ncbi:MAG: monoheme cytochrome c [Rhodobacteraceae bacterium HLUCCA09]|nr:MAG: monoheme cytochrome c [Rhodobacteraceae bacterium HLUCCA09]
MFDTMTLTKAATGFLGAWLIFLLGAWVSDSLYDIGDRAKGEQAYSIAVESDEAPAEPVEELTMEEKFAQADAGRGERVWSKCRACHQLEVGANATGPYLHGVVGREVAAVDGFNYSGALVEQADVWDKENLYAFLEDPSDWAPGTSMSFAGLDAWEDRVNLIAYLETFN